MAKAIVVLLGALLIGCGDDEPGPRGAAGAGAARTCPAELAADSAEWMHPGDDPECAELAEQLNAGLDVTAGDDEGCSGGFDVDRNACTATLESECDGVALSIECDVSSDGAADCEAVVTSAELAAGSCAFGLRLR